MNIDSYHIKISEVSEEEKRIWKILEEIPDPEIPVLSILDLGIVREVELASDFLRVSITPTYSGCPAMDMISAQIRIELAAHGYNNLVIQNQLSPAWTTDWMTESGKQKLREYGIAAPEKTERIRKLAPTDDEPAPSCPRCGTANTKLISQFGSTACKALYQCKDCLEPFDYFKCH